MSYMSLQSKALDDFETLKVESSVNQIRGHRVGSILVDRVSGEAGWNTAWRILHGETIPRNACPKLFQIYTVRATQPCKL